MNEAETRAEHIDPALKAATVDFVSDDTKQIVRIIWEKPQPPAEKVVTG